MLYGTHSLIIGAVREVRLGEEQPPLLYHDARYCISQPRSAAA